MIERAYTVSEVDALRSALENRFLWGRFSPDWSGSRMGRSYSETDKVATVEQWVRTHMLAGHTAEDLIASERILPQTEKGSTTPPVKTGEGGT